MKLMAPKKPAVSSQPLIANEIRVRFAPSPTGPFHIGNARTALFNWLFARQNNGKFILRIEDTDAERSKPEYEKEIVSGLSWLGLEWDEKYKQSERIEIYRKYLERLMAEEKAYYCYCTKEDLEAAKQAMTSQGLPPKYDGHCRELAAPPSGHKPQVIRFKTPQAEVEFKDIIRGKVVFDASLFGDIVIAKDLNCPLYNFAVVVDDEEMHMTHVIRGEDHISNTPKQILLQKALGFRQPEYAHLPLILNPDRSKLSSRFTEVSLISYREKGYLPEAVVNFLTLLGWHSKEDKEVFGREELLAEFDLKRVQKAGAVFNHEKLDWLQKEHLKKLSAEEVAKELAPLLKERGLECKPTFLKKVVEIEKTRITNLAEFLDIANFFFRLPDYDPNLLLWKNETAENAAEILKTVSERIAALPAKNFSKEKLAATLEPVIKERGRGEVLWPLRVALSGKRASPDPLEIAEALGSDEAQGRISTAIAKLKMPGRKR